MRGDGTIRVLLGRAGNVALLEAVEAGSAVAVTFTAAPDRRAFQVKASSAGISEACSDDVPEMDRQCALFRDGLVEIGFSPELAAGFAAHCDTCTSPNGKGRANWSLSELAEAAKVHRNTVSNFETGKYKGSEAAVASIRAALEAAGVEFTNGERPGVRLVRR